MIKIFVGCAPNGEDAESQAVLEYTLRKHASEDIDIVWMRLQRGGFWSGFATERWATPFSGLRWCIPAYCGFEGRAIYMDSDIIVLADIAELWRQDFGGHVALAKHGGRLCVSLWDCAAAKNVVPPIEGLRSDPYAHRAMSARIKGHVGTFKGNWNCLDGESFASIEDPAIKAIHYTDMSCQPHLAYALKRLAATGQKHWFDGTIRPHPRRDLQALFDRLLGEAIAAGYPPARYLPEENFGDFRKKSLVNYKGHAA
jgi:hypothetical protein